MAVPSRAATVRPTAKFTAAMGGCALAAKRSISRLVICGAITEILIDRMPVSHVMGSRNLVAIRIRRGTETFGLMNGSSGWVRSAGRTAARRYPGDPLGSSAMTRPASGFSWK